MYKFFSTFIICLVFSNEFVSVNISIPIIQEIEIINIKSLPDINASDIERGYIDIENAVTLLIKSNVAWDLNVLTNKKYLYNNETINISNIDIGINNIFRTLSDNPVLLISNGQQTSDKLIEISYRRNLSWATCPPGLWSIEPEFILEPSDD